MVREVLTHLICFIPIPGLSVARLKSIHSVHESLLLLHVILNMLTFMGISLISQKSSMFFSNKILTLNIAILILLAACGDKKNQDTGSSSGGGTIEDGAVIRNYVVDPELSEVLWEGRVVGVYGHNGVIDVENGFLTTKGDEITGGTISIDMLSVVPLDSSSYQDRDGSRITDLQHHLTTGDFFLTEKYPTASFTIKEQRNNHLIGDLTIRGVTHEETAILSYLEVLPEGLAGDAELVFDRQKYDIKWEHPVTDYILSDDIEIRLKIVARK